MKTNTENNENKKKIIKKRKNIQTYYGNENVWKKVFTFHENEAKKYIMVLKWVSFSLLSII